MKYVQIDISSDWASRENQKMFLVDTADFYQIFLHIKQIICPSESQPYIKKQEKYFDSIDNLEQNYRWYRYQIFSILAIKVYTNQCCQIFFLENLYFLNFFQYSLWIFPPVYGFFPRLILGLYFRCSCCQKYRLYWNML